MAKKFDKELVKKHHFWFLFIPILIALLVAWIGLFALAADDISVKENKNDDDKKKSPYDKQKPRKTLDVYDVQLKELDTKRYDWWKKGWEAQKDLYVWPSGYGPEQAQFLKEFRFGDQIRDEKNVHELFAFEDQKVYLNEYKQLAAQLEPMQFRDSWRTVLHRDQQDWAKRPDSEDMWLAMEDLWVQREILLAVHKVNAEAAAFKMDSPKNGAKDDPKHRTFRNRTWEVELWIEDDKGNRVVKGKLKNISERLQMLGIGNVMVLEIDLKPGGKIQFEVQGTPLEAGLTEPMVIKTLKSHTLHSEMKVNEIASVKQKFDTRTVPVKRIDYLEIGRAGLSDRHNSGLMKNSDGNPLEDPWRIRMSSFSEEQAKKEKKGDAPPAGAGAPLPTPGPGATPAGSSKQLPTWPSQSQDKLERFRYLDRTEQLRRMPVGLVVITDQMYMDDINESLVNMKLLPMQLTQLEWNRFHDAVEYGPKPMGADRPSGAGSSPTNSRDDQFSANLMQMSVYGVVSLYEPYKPPAPPPKK